MSQCIHPLKTAASTLLLLALTGVFLACAKSDPQNSWKPGETVSISIGDNALAVELALNPASQARGLMKRESLPKNGGMLFVFDKATPRSFWMKNTGISLDIAYIDSHGLIKEIYPMYPNNQNSVKSTSDDIQFALETNQNWFKNHQIVPGATVDLSNVLPIMRDHGILSALSK